MSQQQTNIEPIQDGEIVDVSNDNIIEEVILSSNSSDMEITTDTDTTDVENDILEREYNVENNDNFLSSQTTQEPMFIFGVNNVEESKIEIEIEEEKIGEQKTAEQKTAEQNTEYENMQCSVCYINLNMSNIVNTTCNHKYCSKCFFRWMKSSTSCPMCRKNLVSISKWYEDNDVNDEIEELTVISENIQSSLMEKIRQFEFTKLKNKNLMLKNQTLKAYNNEEMRRKIRLNSDINYSRGYLEALNNDSSKTIKKKLNDKSYRSCPFVQGYHAGYYERNSIRDSFKKSFKIPEVIHSTPKSGTSISSNKSVNYDSDETENSIVF